MQTLKLSGKSDAKGRSGYYKLYSVDTWITRDADTVYVDFLGKRGIPNARLALTPEDWNVLRAFFKSTESAEHWHARERAERTEMEAM